VQSRSPSLWRGARVVKRDAGLLARGAAKSIYGFAYSYLNVEGAVHDAIVSGPWGWVEDVPRFEPSISRSFSRIRFLPI
jgi:hypothetical protein